VHHFIVRRLPKHRPRSIKPGSAIALHQGRFLIPSWS
jgi:hypothetical protein